MEDSIDPTVGFVIAVKPGDKVERGQPVASIYAASEEGLAIGSEALRKAIELGEEPPSEVLPLISHRVTAAGVEVLS